MTSSLNFTVLASKFQNKSIKRWKRSQKSLVCIYSISLRKYSSYINFLNNLWWWSPTYPLSDLFGFLLSLFCLDPETQRDLISKNTFTDRSSCSVFKCVWKGSSLPCLPYCRLHGQLTLNSVTMIFLCETLDGAEAPFMDGAEAPSDVVICYLTLLFPHRSVCSSRDRCGRPQAAVYPATQLRQGVGAWLPPTKHQTHAMLGRGSPASCSSAAGWGAAHHAFSRPRAY